MLARFGNGLLADLPLTHQIYYFPSAGLTVGIEIFTLQSGTCWFTMLSKFSNGSKISLEGNLLTSFIPAWIIKWLGLFVIIGMRLCSISSTFAPEKLRTFRTQLSRTTSFKIFHIFFSVPIVVECFIFYTSVLLLLTFNDKS